MRRHTRTARFGAYVASGALALTGLTLVSAPAEAAPDPAQDGASWLAGELTDGLMHYPDTGFGAYDDHGLSIDAAMALRAVGGHEPAVQQVSTAVAAQLDKYITGASFDDPGSTYAGAVAKSAVFAHMTGKNPRAFGGVNLISRLEGRVSNSTPTLGRISDVSSFGDNANTLGQAFAARALTQAGSTKAASVTTFLLKQQCASGYFRQNFTLSKSVGNQSCSDGVDASSPDATAVAVLQLANQTCSPAVGSAIAKAIAWLKAQQQGDGSFATTSEGTNANTTGLAATALAGSSEAGEASTWIRAHQVTSAEDANELADEDGAIAYNDASLATGRTDGITDSTVGEWRRASAQALPALGEFTPVVPSTSPLAMSGPPGFARERSAVVVTTAGARAGDGLCLAGPGVDLRKEATNAPWQARVVLPAGTANRRYAVRDAYGHTAARTVKVLGRKTLRVTTPQFRRPRRSFVTATIAGLVPGEQASIFYKGALKKRGVAGPRGRFSARFKVGSSRGRKLIVGHGQFAAMRRGVTTIKVVR